jgi:acyl carrier protein
MKTTFERVKEVIASYDHNGHTIYIKNIDEDLYGDLGMDSLAVVESVMLCEDEFDIHVEDDDIVRLKTVGDLVNLIDRKIENK